MIESPNGTNGQVSTNANSNHVGHSRANVNNRFRLTHFGRCQTCIDSFGKACEELLSADVVPGAQITSMSDLAALAPGIVLVDTDLPDWFDIAEEVRAKSTTARLVFVGTSASDLCIKQALVLGARGFLLKEESLEVLVGHLRAIAQGEYRFTSTIDSRLAFDEKQGEYRLKGGGPIDSLNAIQFSILRYLARGDSLKMVARKMNLSRKSVDGHKYRLMRKIGIKDRVLLSRFAIREGLIEA